MVHTFRRWILNIFEYVAAVCAAQRNRLILKMRKKTEFQTDPEWSKKE